MAVYSLTGNDSSPFPAEPAHSELQADGQITSIFRRLLDTFGDQYLHGGFLRFEFEAELLL